MHNIKINYMKHILEHRFVAKDNPSFNYKLSAYIYKVNKELVFKPNPGIYQTIMNEINLDFGSINISSVTTNSVYSSPIIERININNIFNTFTTNTASIIEPTINNLGISSNRNSLTLNTSLDVLNNRPRNKELLNYQSNILYLLINNLSLSIY